MLIKGDQEDGDQQLFIVDHSRGTFGSQPGQYKYLGYGPQSHCYFIASIWVDPRAGESSWLLLETPYSLLKTPCIHTQIFSLSLRRPQLGQKTLLPGRLPPHANISLTYLVCFIFVVSSIKCSCYAYRYNKLYTNYKFSSDPMKETFQKS